MNYKLLTLARHFEVAQQETHRALADLPPSIHATVRYSENLRSRNGNVPSSYYYNNVVVTFVRRRLTFVRDDVRTTTRRRRRRRRVVRRRTTYVVRRRTVRTGTRRPTVPTYRTVTVRTVLSTRYVPYRYRTYLPVTTGR